MGDMESSEIVGYSVKELSEGNQAVATQFYTIGKEGVSLLDLTFDTSAYEKIDGSLNIQLLDANGYTTQRYDYYKGMTRGAHTVDGWYDSTKGGIITADNDPVFKNGQGLWLGSPAGVKMTTAGGVLKDSQQFELIAGNQMIANPFPVAVKLLDLVLGGTAATAEKIDGSINIQILDKNGYTVQRYDYYKGMTRGAHTIDGWYDSTNGGIVTTDNNPSFLAGAALWFGGIDGATVTFPAPKF